MYLRTQVLVCFCFAFYGTCLAAGNEWYPKASDTCESFSTEFKAHSPIVDKHPELWRDKTISKLKSALYASDVRAAEEKTEELRSLDTLILLAMYCDSHGTIRLRDIRAADIFASFKGGAVRSNDYKTAEDWYNDTIGKCGSDNECIRIATSYRNHARTCYMQADQQACTDVERDRKDWAARGSSAATSTPKDAMMQCLQDAAVKTVATCRETNCDKSLLYDMVGYTQKALCGYSAIEPIQSRALNLIPTQCNTNPTSGGGWITSCF